MALQNDGGGDFGSGMRIGWGGDFAISKHFRFAVEYYIWNFKEAKYKSNYGNAQEEQNYKVKTTLSGIKTALIYRF